MIRPSGRRCNAEARQRQPVAQLRSAPEGFEVVWTTLPTP